MPWAAIPIRQFLFGKSNGQPFGNSALSDIRLEGQLSEGLWRKTGSAA